MMKEQSYTSVPSDFHPLDASRLSLSLPSFLSLHLPFIFLSFTLETGAELLWLELVRNLERDKEEYIGDFQKTIM